MLFVFAVQLKTQAIQSSPTWIQSADLQNFQVSGFCGSGDNFFAASYLLYTSYVYICHSTDNGVTWRIIDTIPVNNKPPNQYLWTSPHVTFLVDDTNLFAGIGDCYSGGVYSSSDSGMHWSEKDTGFHENINNFAVIGETMFAGTNNGVFRSTDHGAHWSARNTGLSYDDYDSIYGHAPQVMRLATIGTNLFAGTTGEGLFLSTDFGGTWKGVDSGLTNTSMSIYGLTTLNSKIYAGVFQGFADSTGGVFMSTDYATTWNAAENGLTRHTINVLVSFGTNLYAGTNYGVFLSTDEGANWLDISGGPPLDTIAILTIAVSDPNLVLGTLNGMWRCPLSQLITAVESGTGENQTEFALEQNFPQPFNPGTTIQFSIPHESHVTLKIYNLLGQEVQTLVNGTRRAGTYDVQFDAGKLSSGVYFYTLQAGAFVQTKKMLVIK